MADTTPTPEWMHFVNFDGRLTGETAKMVKQVAEELQKSPEDVLTEALRTGLESLNLATRFTSRRDATVSPWTANEGCGGFHVVTVVADGYGFIVAENQNGKERARVACQDPDEVDTDPGKDLVNLMAEFTKVVEAERNA